MNALRRGGYPTVTASLGQAQRSLLGEAFQEADVARCYALRPPYAPALYESLFGKVAGRDRALDLGCGPGKIATVLADHFGQVVALDSSAAMLAAGRAADAGRHANIRWTRSRAEDYHWTGRYDIVTAGTSIHWLDHSRVFPKIANCAKTLAVITGDEPAPPPCGQEAWSVFLRPWLARLATSNPGVCREYDPAAIEWKAKRHEAWMDISGREQFAFTFRQSIADFIESQHSRATWSRAVMGNVLAKEFDQGLADLVRPCAMEGVLELHMMSELSWGTPRKTPRDS